MTQPTTDAANALSEMSPRQEREGALPRASASENAGVGDQSAAKPVRGVLERRWRRKNKINGLPGLIREHARLIRAMHDGRISLEKGEILSRAYGRHQAMVAAHEQREYLADLQQRLEQLTSGKPALLPPGDGEATP